MTLNTISAGKVVAFHYTLTDADGDVIDTSSGRAPLDYLHGAGNIVPGLERQLEGLVVGARLDAVVPAAEGYGERQFPGPQAVPREAFPEDVEIHPGMQFAAQGPRGEMIPLWVKKVEAETVWVDRNHPLAGVELHFAVEIVSIRGASDEELAHGHPHGPDGHGGHGHDHDHG